MSKDSSSSSASGDRRGAAQDPGISNRESAGEERAERAAHPPVNTNPPASEDETGRLGEQPSEDQNDLQTSQKAGTRSTAQKETASRYPDSAMPASKKVPGAFGKEPNHVESNNEPE